MYRDFVDEEYSFLIRYFRYNLFRKLLSSFIWIIVVVDFCMLFYWVVSGEYTPHEDIGISEMFVVGACFFISPILHELKSYRYIQRKDFKTYMGVCTRRDFDIVPKARGYEISYYVDIQDDMTGNDFKNTKVPRYIYKKTHIGETCNLVIVNPRNAKLIYVCPISHHTKRPPC